MSQETGDLFNISSIVIYPNEMNDENEPETGEE